ncbi:uncharacterized protein BDZ99DRAFT_527314 [Mytilinidion resinicola]|uniref:Uncharacterized protein n=1 Tax=Mytilinidion resinicola TaxID=574789 RepID=A0A6A6Y194_9PEZI|nr:uncharacterized protein BDZ99DRAFT_527314 [Mytilinidion resinicola]KAF2802586.1 hypothetical protein BDZ99DRAFT_527314 [Mytilinidion resinicola]
MRGKVYTYKPSPLPEVAKQRQDVASHGNPPPLHGAPAVHHSSGSTTSVHDEDKSPSSSYENLISSDEDEPNYPTPPCTPSQSEQGDEITPPPIPPKPKPTKKNYNVPKMPNMLELDDGGHWQIPVGDGFLHRSKRINPTLRPDLQNPCHTTRRKAKLLRRAGIEVTLAKPMH